MKNLHVYIVEDEPLIVINLTMALKKNGISIAGSSDEYEEAIEEIKKSKPSLVLLDIQIQSDKDGVDVAMWLEERDIPFLFLTSQTDPVTLSRVKQTNPLGYIVKPFTEAGLLSNIELAWHSIKAANEKNIPLKSEGKTYQIKPSTIQYLRAFDNYCYVVTPTKEYLIPHTLKYMAEQLDPALFFQCHRSYWVNLQKIVAVHADKIQVDTVEIPIGYSRKKEIKQLLGL